MAGSALWRGVERAVNQGLRGSRDALDRARSKARELGERGALRLDLLQLERQRGRLLQELGALVHDRLGAQGQAAVSRGADGVKDLLLQIDDVTERCAEKRAALEQLAAQNAAPGPGAASPGSGGPGSGGPEASGLGAGGEPVEGPSGGPNTKDEKNDAGRLTDASDRV